MEHCEKTCAAFFACGRYWPDEEQLRQSYGQLCGEIFGDGTPCELIRTPQQLQALQGVESLILVPMSGGVQPLMLQAAKQCRTVVLYAAYILGNCGRALCESMLEKNAAPSLMDTWAVLRREHAHAELALQARALEDARCVFDAYLSVQGARLLLVGETEPWVISASRNLEDYEKLGVTVVRAEQQELADLYAGVTGQQAAPYYDYFTGGAKAVVEPTRQDVWNASRMAAALLQLLKKYDACGMALACFQLLALGTTSCLGVSYINDCTPFVAACEGDLDSAVTMLAVKKLTNARLWMANPGLHPGGVINFSHCTAAVHTGDGEACPFTLRSHHESGIGASVQVEYPLNRTVTLCRIGAGTGQMTVQTGTTMPGPYEKACRTQLYVQMADFDRYLATALGCHQVLCFADIAARARALAGHLGLQLL